MLHLTQQSIFTKGRFNCLRGKQVMPFNELKVKVKRKRRCSWVRGTFVQPLGGHMLEVQVEQLPPTYLLDGGACVPLVIDLLVSRKYRN